MVVLAILLAVSFLPQVPNHVFTADRAQISSAVQSAHISYSENAESVELWPAKVTDTGLIFYPGALVDAKSYVPKLAAAAHTAGIKIFIVKPPFRLAYLGTDSPDSIIRRHQNIKHWFVGGHSMGGGAACTFAGHHGSQVAGLILFAAYCAKHDTAYPGPVLALTGGNDRLEQTTKIAKRLPKNTELITIVGADHASFGDYGGQPFDAAATISESNMTERISNSVAEFIARNR